MPDFWNRIIIVSLKFLGLIETGVFSFPTFFSHLAALGQVQTPYFTWAESNANEQNPLFSLICIRFGSCEVRRLNLPLVYFLAVVPFLAFLILLHQLQEKKRAAKKILFALSVIGGGERNETLQTLLSGLKT